jgi:hypothetical protein
MQMTLRVLRSDEAAAAWAAERGQQILAEQGAARTIVNFLERLGRAQRCLGRGD